MDGGMGTTSCGDISVGDNAPIEVDVGVPPSAMSVVNHGGGIDPGATAQLLLAADAHLSNYYATEQRQQPSPQVTGPTPSNPPPQPFRREDTVVESQQPPPAPELEIACTFCGSSEGVLLDCGVTQTGVSGGRCRRHGEGPPSGDDTRDNKHVCNRRFHFLCGWFAGSYVKISTADPSFTLGARCLSGNMDEWPAPGEPKHGFPAGMLVEMRCLDHSRGPDGRGKLPTSVEEQAELRAKYRLKVGYAVKLRLSVVCGLRAYFTALLRTIALTPLDSPSPRRSPRLFIREDVFFSCRRAACIFLSFQRSAGFRCVQSAAVSSAGVIRDCWVWRVCTIRLLVFEAYAAYSKHVPTFP